ncbi:hypothetical protein AAF712_006799 [Marasmius tenuissimus]|uniref:Hexosyltransferase n=1 Tax=Marasmius tenuissimus TaxID=585030 RepID=A0ABR2ZZH1_9AGAR
MALSRVRLTLFAVAFLAFLLLFFPGARTVHERYISYSSSPSSSSTPKRPNGVIFMLLPPSRVHQAMLALWNVENRFNRRLQYPYVLFMTEKELAEVSEEDKSKIDWITEGRAKFATLTEESWEIPEFLDKSRVQQLAGSHRVRRSPPSTGLLFDMCSDTPL